MKAVMDMFSYSVTFCLFVCLLSNTDLLQESKKMIFFYVP